MYVGNLSFETTQDDLRTLFDAHGTVTDVILPEDRVTGKSRGFAFVTMNSEGEAAAAIAALHDTHQQGRKLVVNMAEPRNEQRSGNSPRRQVSHH